MSDKQEQCVCTKSTEIDQIQKDIRSINKNYIDVYAILTNGLSTEFPLLRVAVDKLATRIGKIEKTQTTSDSNKRPKVPRIVGTVVIVGIFSIFAFGFMLFVLKSGIITPEDFGKLIGAIIND